MRSSGRFASFVRKTIDLVNIILAVIVIVLVVMVFVKTDKYKGLFMIIFSIGAGINFITGIKFYMTERKGSAIAAWIAAVVLGVIAYFTYRIVGGI